MPADVVGSIQSVRVVDLDIKFTSMIILFVKAAVAAIPAAIILAVVGTMASGVILGLLSSLR